MNINIQNIRFENFLSYDIGDFNFNNGIDLIIGKNGVGKSATIDALFYVLFGKPFRKIKNASLINTKGKKNKLKVTLNMEIDGTPYKVIRGQKPNIFEIYKEDELMEQLASTKAYQDMLENEILQVNELIFRQLVAVSSNLPNSKPFMDLTIAEKEEMFQIITDTSIFSKLKETIKSQLKDNKVILDDYEYKKVLWTNSLESEQAIIKSQEQQNKDFKQYHTKNIEDTEKSINVLQIKIKDNELSLIKLKKLKLEYDKAVEELKKLKDDLSNEKTSDTENHNNNLKLKEKTINELKDEMITLKYDIDKKNVEDTAAIDEEYQNDLKILNKTKEDSLIILQTDRANIDERITQKYQLNLKLSEKESNIKTIEQYEEGSIECTNCQTINYIGGDIDLIKSKQDIISEITDYKIQIEKLETLISLAENDYEIKKQDITDKISKDIDIIKIKSIENKKIITDKYIIFKEEILTKQSFITNKEKEMELAHLEYMNSLNTLYKDEEADILRVEDNISELKAELLTGKNIMSSITQDNIEKRTLEIKLDELLKIKEIEIDYTNIQNTSKNLQKLEDDIIEVIKLIDDLKTIENIVGKNNLKSQVIKGQVPFLNREINGFLDLFNMNNVLNHNFIIDEEFKSKVIPKDSSEEEEMNQLSNGQKSRISFSIMFAFLKLIETRNGVSINILFLDEILDSSVDSEGREELLNILKYQFKDTKDIIIISHNNEIKQKEGVFDRIITITRDVYSKVLVS